MGVGGGEGVVRPRPYLVSEVNVSPCSDPISVNVFIYFICDLSCLGTVLSEN